jgi:hypothetical protein
MTEYNTANKARLHRYHGHAEPHVRVYKQSPEDLNLQISLGKRAVSLSLSPTEAEAIANLLLGASADVRRPVSSTRRSWGH